MITPCILMALKYKHAIKMKKAGIFLQMIVYRHTSTTYNKKFILNEEIWLFY